jgi:hypothetical protein
MPTGWTLSVLPVTAFKAKIFEYMAALFAFKLMNGHVYEPPDFRIEDNIIIFFPVVK